MKPEQIKAHFIRDFGKALKVQGVSIPNLEELLSESYDKWCKRTPHKVVERPNGTLTAVLFDKWTKGDAHPRNFEVYTFGEVEADRMHEPWAQERKRISYYNFEVRGNDAEYTVREYVDTDSRRARTSPVPDYRASQKGEPIISDPCHRRVDAFYSKRDSKEVMHGVKWFLGQLPQTPEIDAITTENKGDPYMCRKALKKILVATENQRRHAVANEFIRYLPQEVIATQRTINDVSPITFNYLYQSQQPEVMKRRLQAVIAYPGLVRLFRNSPGLTRVIDAGGELVPAIKRAVGDEAELDVVTNSVLKTLSPRKRAVLTSSRDRRNYGGEAAQIKNVARVLAALPPEHHPKTEQEWKDFQTAYRFFADSNARTPFWMEEPRKKKHEAIPIHKRMTEFGGDWGRVAGLTARYRKYGYYYGDLKKIDDYKRAIFEDVVLMRAFELADEHGLSVDMSDRWDSNGWLVRNHDVNKFIQHLPHLKATAEQISDAEIAWHDNIREIRHRRKQICGQGSKGANEVRWGALIDPDKPVQASNGLWVRALTTKHALDVEADEMSHCVYMYTRNCLFEGSHILSLSKDRGGEERVSTAQVSHDSYRDTYHTHQHYRKRNTPVSARERDALNEVLGNLSPDWGKINAQTMRARNAYREHGAAS